MGVGGAEGLEGDRWGVYTPLLYRQFSRTQAGTRTGGKLMQDGSEHVLTTGQNLDKKGQDR